MGGTVIENMWTAVVLGIVVVLAVLAVRKIRKDRKAGIHSCGGNCGACALGELCAGVGTCDGAQDIKTNKAETSAEIQIPKHVREALNTLSDAGHEAFIVGGCVRDSIMRKTPNDWNVCTSASPAETKVCFAGKKTIDIGMQHGTIGVVFALGGDATNESAAGHHEVVEITTYRVDGEYKDSRHPESVNFTKRIEEDLARRDFTMNAIAYSPKIGYVDPYGGQADIENKKIKAVGNPEKRFAEDALRVMRGLRFAAQLGFDIDGETEAAMDALAETVRHISAERVQVELSKLIEGAWADRVFQKYGAVLVKAVPGIECAPVGRFPNMKSVRLAVVFPKETEERLRELRFDNKTVAEATALARLFAGDVPEDRIAIRRCIRSEGLEIATLYMSALGREQEIYDIIARGECCTLRQLDITGKDLIDMGITDGKKIGATLEKLLDEVIEERVANEKKELMEAVKKWEQ